MPSGTHSIKYLKNILINSLRIANIKYDYIYHPSPNPSKIYPSFHTHLILCPHFKKKTTQIQFMPPIYFWVYGHPRSWCKRGLKYYKSRKWWPTTAKQCMLDTVGQ